MSKPINPDIAIPSEFAADGQKRNFTEEKIQHGFNSVAKDTLEGDCLNKFIDDTYKGLNYAMDGVEDLYDVTDDLKDLSNLSASGQAILDNKANKDLSNLSSTGEAHFANPDLSNLSPTGQAILDNKANISLSNLSASGNNRLHALKGYLDDGEVLTDAEGLADVVNYAHSTFDLSKFSSFIQGTSLVISNDGIASSFSNNPANNIKITTVPTTNNYAICGEFTMPNPLPSANIIPFSAGATVGGSTVLLFSLRYNASNQRLILLARNTDGNNTTIENANITAAAGISYKFKIIVDNANVSFYINDTLVNSMDNFSEVLPEFLIIGADRNNSFPFEGSIDLKQIAIIEAGITIFSGNKTGVDTYTIGGNTVTIPYTLSITGSKVVNAIYRDRVNDMAEQFGYAPYYTLDEANGNFTLPQGEIYGMMLNQSVPHIIETYQNGMSGYVVYSNGYCEQWGRGVTDNDGWCAISLLKEYRDTNYIPIANQCYGISEVSSVVYADIVSTDDMVTTAFRAFCSTNADTPAQNAGIAWITKGYINL